MFKPLHKIEFHDIDKINKTRPTIGLLMMVKNEELRIHVSLESVKNIVDAIIIYDTGSSDKTIDIIVDFVKKNKINLYLIQGEFEDFSTSRNISLDFADTINVKYLLLLDSNDELKSNDNFTLKKIAFDFQDKDPSGFLLCQQWKSGSEHTERIDKYYNIRFIKNKNRWRYKGSVHEWISKIDEGNTDPNIKNESGKYIQKVDDSIFIFQDRTKDDDKSFKRFTKDRECLLRDFKKNSEDPRTIFYLGQTCQCLNLHDESLYYNRLRTEYEGFQEEVFHAFFRCGLSATALRHSWDDIMPWYMKAFGHSLRAEPLYKIAEYYRGLADLQSKQKKQNFNTWKIAFMFIDQACNLSYPDDAILFVDRAIYDYGRWHLMGIIGFYAHEFKRGKEGAMKAFEHSKKEIDEKNIKCYIDIEKKIEEEKKKIEKKIEEEIKSKKTLFINETMNELKNKFPRTSHKDLIKRAEKLWEKHVNKPT